MSENHSILRDYALGHNIWDRLDPAEKGRPGHIVIYPKLKEPTQADFRQELINNKHGNLSAIESILRSENLIRLLKVRLTKQERDHAKFEAVNVCITSTIHQK